MGLRNLLNYALSNGADEAEIYVKYGRREEVKSTGYRVRNSSMIEILTSIRIIIGRSIASASLTSDSPDLIRKFIDRLITIARNTPKDPYWDGLPSPEPGIVKESTWSSELTKVDQELLTSWITRDLDLLRRRYEGVKPVKVNYVYSEKRFKLINSNGIDIEDKVNHLSYLIEVKMAENGREAVTFNYARSRRPEIDSARVIDEAYGRVRELLNRVRYKRIFRGPVMMDPLATATTLFFSLTRVITGTAVTEGYSPYKDKIGMNVASGEVTIIDNGVMDGGWGTKIYDEEGVPQKKTIIIDRGVLKGFIHNNYTARRMGVTSTGNAIRRDGGIDIGITNLVVKPSNLDPDKLISSYDEVIMVRNMPMNAHTTNFITGALNMVGTELYLYRRGSLESILEPLTITGNIYEALRTARVCSDFRDTFFNIYTPSILIEGLTLA